MLLDEIEKLKKEIAENEGQLEEKEEEVVEEFEEEVEEEKEEEIKKEEKPKEQAKEEKLDDGAYMKLRREALAEKRRAEQLAKELEELRKAKEPEQVIEQPTLSPELESVIQEHRMSRAEREFLMLENKVKQQNPEYNAVAAEYTAAMYQALKLQNPRKSDIELGEMTKTAILLKAAEYARAGYENPAEEIYHEARELGFTGKSQQKQIEAQEEKLQPDMRKVAENRKRSTGMTGANGKSEGQMTLNHAATSLTAAEWARLPKAEKQRLLYNQ